LNAHSTSRSYDHDDERNSEESWDETGMPVFRSQPSRSSAIRCQLSPNLATASWNSRTFDDAEVGRYVGL
jgi:hypothetical protein